MLLNYKKDFAKFLFESWIPMTQNTIVDTIELVPSNIQWDLWFPCFKLSKELKKAPNQIAKEFAEKIGAIFRLTSAKNKDGIEQLFYSIACKNNSFTAPLTRSTSFIFLKSKAKLISACLGRTTNKKW